MDMYSISTPGTAENYLVQGAENPLLMNPLLEQAEAMYNQGVPEFFVDQGIFYPTAANYAYYCTGFESPGEWEDHNRIFGADGPDVQFAGAHTESLPYVYYTPSYGYAESPYNPYNPHIPGAMVGIDASYVGAQQYYPIASYRDPVSSPGYVPVVVQPDFIPNNLTDPPLGTGAAFMNRSDARDMKDGLSSSSTVFPKSQTKSALNLSNSFSKISEGQRASVGTSKQSLTHGSVSFGAFPTSSPSHLLQGRGASDSVQPVNKISNGKILPHSNQLKFSAPANNGFSGFGSNALGRTSADKLQSKIHVNRMHHDMNGGPDALVEQNRGPRTNKSKNQLTVKAFTNKVGDGNAQGNIIIYTDQFNKDDFPVDYFDAKFFVIKSYSEDDVHKSIKYNVWSSTPHGNKKLQSAYEDAQKISAGNLQPCSVFLFFSVNGSGQFCGVAEMIGSVDFLKDMDFWQQDKWSGSFPVKWHIIKDVPNSSFRHIILENNENKPVTNSRDTQEIMYKRGLEMLKIFKNYRSKTSLLDDFIYYENRQRIMQEEKSRLLFKRYETPFTIPVLDAVRKLDSVVMPPPSKLDKATDMNGPNGMKKPEAFTTERVSSDSGVANAVNGSRNSEHSIIEDDIASGLNIGSLSINSKEAEVKLSSAAATVVSSDPVDIVTVGSVPIKVNGPAEFSGVLRVGSISLDPKALESKKRQFPG